MKKIDLSIFDINQLEEIETGLRNNVDISIYAKPEFNSLEMREIRLGLEDKLDVSIYAKKEFNYRQMEEIREGLENNLNVNIYAKPVFNELQMEEIKLGLKNNIDVNIYSKPYFDNWQMSEIRLGLESNINVDIYAKNIFDALQMCEIRIGLESNFDVSIYANPEFYYLQMREIRLGLEKGIDVSSYANTKFDYLEMLNKRLELKNDLEKKRNPDFIPKPIKEKIYKDDLCKEIEELMEIKNKKSSMKKEKLNGCLVLIDLQKGFINDNEGIIKNIKLLLNKYEFDYIVATKFINESNGPYFKLLNYKEMTESDPNNELHPFIKEISNKIITKNLYSCFNEDFITYLKENNIQKLYFAGIDSEACVLKSVFDCFERNIDFKVFKDCCKSNNGENLENATEEIIKIIAGEDKLI